MTADANCDANLLRECRRWFTGFCRAHDAKHGCSACALLRALNARFGVAPEVDDTPRTGETPLKEWTLTEAQRLRISHGAVYARLRRGGYPHLTLRRATKSNLVFVKKMNSLADDDDLNQKQ